MKLIRRKRSSAVARWLKDETAQQRRRWRSLVAAQDALAPRRSRWIAQFLARIQTRGCHVHADELRKVRPDELPSQPRRRFRVVF